MNLIQQYSGAFPFRQILMQDALNQIKTDIENAIITGGEAGKNALIRSQAPIKLIHDAVKTAFYNNGQTVHESLINPSLDHLELAATAPASLNNIILHDHELCLAGLLKKKDQDISIVPKNIPIQKQILPYPTLLHGFVDEYGFNFTESVLSVNVRSQLSSAAKNFDTLYERTFAEALNLHLRCPKMVLGEVYLILVKEYDSRDAANNRVNFKNSQHVEKYILAFNALNNRVQATDPEYKYERVALLVVDFSQTTPKIYNTTQELINDGLISANSGANMTNLSFNSFVSDLLSIYSTRFPQNSFI